MNKPEDFETTFKKWESIKPNQKEMLEEKKSIDNATPKFSPTRKNKLKPQEEIDLHSLTREEARVALTHFINDSFAKGLQMIRIVHGKGLHSDGDSILKKVVRECLESNPFTGKNGPEDRTKGGSGATWVVLRKKSDKELGS